MPLVHSNACGTLAARVAAAVSAAVGGTFQRARVGRAAPSAISVGRGSPSNGVPPQPSHVRTSFTSEGIMSSGQTTQVHVTRGRARRVGAAILVAAMVVAHGGSIAWGQVGSLAEGTLVAWGVYPDSESPRPAEPVVPAGTFIAIAAGADHSLGMRSDGTLAGWGYNDWGQATVPAGTFAAISGGTDHSIGLRPNGTVVGWGRNLEGQITIPAGT